MLNSFKAEPSRRSGGLGPLAFFLALGCTKQTPQQDLATSPDGYAAEPSAHADGAPSVAPPEAAATAERQAPDKVSGSRPTETRALPVDGFGAAVVVVPLAGNALPVLLAAHGAGDTPEWQCEHWGGVARGRFFVLCPRGLPLVRGDDSAFYYPDHHALEREVTAGLRALRGAFGARVAKDGGVYTGYSQGATMGALMVVEHGGDFQHLLLVEGGSGDWTLGRARRFHATGGKSVAIVCGTPGCASRGKSSAATLERAGLRARSEHVEGGGHTYIGPVGVRAQELLDGWLLKGD